MWHHCYKRGITLIEMMVVVAISATLISIAIPTYRKYRKQSYQLEAKNNLSMVRRASIAYQLEHNILNGNLKTIGALPKGNIQYNIGADWDPPAYNQHKDRSTDDTSTQSFATQFCPCCEQGATYPNGCCSEAIINKTVASGTCSAITNKCYGDPDQTMATNLQAIDSVLFTNVLSNKRKPDSSTNHTFQFKFYAIGCVSKVNQPSDMDVWSIDERNYLKNEKNAAM